MRPIDAESSEGRVKLHSAIHGDGAYEAFKRIASEFYENHTYKFVALTLDGEPRSDIVTFTAEFWCVPDGAKETPPNGPLTLEELRKMDGEPVWVVQVDGECRPFWMLVDVEDESASNRLYAAMFEDYGTGWLAYRRKPEDNS